MKRMRRRRQGGMAAIEFACVLAPAFAILYGIATFGAAFYTQQALERAAEDGARATPVLTNAAMPDAQQVSNVVYDSLAASLVVPMAASQDLAARRAWIASHVAVTVAGSALITVSVRYPYRDNPLLPSMPLVDASRWLPDTLLGSATLANPP